LSNSGLILIVITIIIVNVIESRLLYGSDIAFPLVTSGTKIVDSNGQQVILGCGNWYGAEEKDFIVAGLEISTITDIVAVIKSFGFNCIRLPFSNQLIEQNSIANSTVITANKNLDGLHVLNVLDAVVEAVTNAGIMIILDNHMSIGDWCCSQNDGNGLWYTEQYPQTAWLNDWVTIVKRYQSNPLVIGVDLRNELREACFSNGTCINPTWGSGSASTDWHQAAELGGNTVHTTNPNLLIFVEVMNYATDGTMVKNTPIKLNVQNKLVYEIHDYSWDISYQSTCTDYFNYWESEWGYIVTEQGAWNAPIWLGEFGTCNTATNCVTDTAPSQGLWFSCLIAYIKKIGISWGYWALNGTEARGTGRTFGAPEGYGVLNVHWNNTANAALLQALQSIMVSTNTTS